LDFLYKEDDSLVFFMPELPEVEALRKGLVEYLIGRKIQKVLVNKPKLVSGNGTKRIESQEKKIEFEKELQGEVFKKIWRRAKNLIFEMESGKTVVVHLKMTGQLVYKDDLEDGLSKTARPAVVGGHPIGESIRGELPNKHSHVIFELDKGVLYYNDVRMFGYVLYYPNELEFKKSHTFADLGLEPDDPKFTVAYFIEEMKKRKSILKAVLLSQKVVVGLGNIYCDETCFEAGIRPDRRCSTLAAEETEALHKAISRIIPLAIKMGGTSISDYLLADGSRGGYMHELKVYSRGGKPCLTCAEKLEKIQLAGRTTVFCANCQK